MAKVLVTDTNLTNIANAIRGKNGSSSTYTPAQMSTAITQIPTGSTNSRCWVLTQSNDSTQGGTITIVSGDSWLQSKRSNTTLNISLIPVTVIPTSTVSLIVFITSNSIIQNNSYSIGVRMNVSGNAQAVCNGGHPLTATADKQFGFRVAEDGTLTFRARDYGVSNIVRAGTYLITASVQE